MFNEKVFPCQAPSAVGNPIQIRVVTIKMLIALHRKLRTFEDLYLLDPITHAVRSPTCQTGKGFQQLQGSAVNRFDMTLPPHCLEISAEFCLNMQVDMLKE